MRWFKHFTDSHRGQSLQQIKKQFGLIGIARYWILVELCAEKMEKKRDEEFTESHCVFEFEKSYLMGCLGYGNLLRTSSYLDALGMVGLCSVDATSMVYRCSMPKLLECMDRDTSRPRPVRVRAASGPRLDIDIDRDRDKEEEKDSKKATGVAPTLPKLAQIWNENCATLPKVISSNNARNKKCSALMKEISEDEWQSVIARISRSSFCCGQNDRSWTATFDWLLQSDTRLKVQEGKYDDKLKIVPQKNNWEPKPIQYPKAHEYLAQEEARRKRDAERDAERRALEKGEGW